jgi:hypothetical protein
MGQPISGAAVIQLQEIENQVMKLLVIPVLIATALLAQGPGGFAGRRGADGNSNKTPPTAAQLAARELHRIATFLRLDSAQTSALTGNSTLVGQLTAEETSLQANAATLKTDYSTLATQLIGAPSVTPAELATIESLRNTDLQLRITAAAQILSALQILSPGLSTEQTANLPGLIHMLAGNGGLGGLRR